MSHSTAAAIYLASLSLGSIGLLELGRRAALRRREAGEDHSNFAVIEGAMFALLGLLIAFTFSGAAERFERRRALIVEEANAIGTAYLRVDLLPIEARSTLRSDFARYVDSRLAVYRAIPDVEAVKERLARSTEIQLAIWVRAIEAAGSAGRPEATMLIVPALNAMIDITTMRTVALQTHPPLVVFGMLGILVWICSLLAGFGVATTQRRSHIHILAFIGILTITVFVIVDYEYPRVGFIRVDAVDQVLVDLRASMP